MRISILLLSGLMFFAIAGCDLSGKQEVSSVEYIHLKLKSPLPDTLYLDSVRWEAAVKLHLRCSVEHSNLWSNLSFMNTKVGDTVFHYAAVASLFYEGNEGNGIPITKDTAVSVGYRIPVGMTVDSGFSQKLYIHLISPPNSIFDTLWVLPHWAEK